MGGAKPAAMPETDGGLKPRTKFYPSVQGLRGFAALSVFCLHLYRMALHGEFTPHIPPALDAALSTLVHGVGLFFIISGFVIPASLVRHGDLRRFIADRLLRIMPLFVILHFIVFIIGPLIGYKWLRDIGPLHYAELFLANLTFTARPLGLLLAQQNSWTLSYEWGFYIMVGAAWLATERTKRVWAMAAIGAVVLALCAEFPIWQFFILGMMFARYRPAVRLGRVVELILVPACLVSYYYAAEFIDPTVALLPAAVLFLAVLGPSTLTTRLLGTRALQFLGKISYSFYLVHPLAVFPFQMIGLALAHRGLNHGPIFVLYLACAVPTTLVASTLSYHFIETRLREAIARRMSFGRPAPIATRGNDPPLMTLPDIPAYVAR